MRLSTAFCSITALFSASSTLADTIETPTASPTSDDYRAEITPFPGTVEDPVHLEIRQGGVGVTLGATLDPDQVPAITIYTLASQVGATAAPVVYTYTQLFSPVPDQWPSAKAGVIGLGSSKQKREAEAQPEPQAMITGIAGRIRPQR